MGESPANTVQLQALLDQAGRHRWYFVSCNPDWHE